ncbi:hypothetical protein K493DRAFT_357420 [Basidiobolus meristosporus CBS 931.73]|uniref:Mechanosensitive ion channel MscS domain-containing protein n=1 Tax=Basidiobolus meristosporus CBS 931.73 TaxID=1314790 RepID=A0A1Y1XW58_9FUNG|nr:hypothetical protein K493DRAFT_357420 [Basidiobolus meristosporus CBS 931.73]|eukprot:ORX89972.1 hypothetical protein K493DRAFT_357420 [Basidiobolus meristosporus CBS 931.73]
MCLKDARSPNFHQASSESATDSRLIREFWWFLTGCNRGIPYTSDRHTVSNIIVYTCVVLSRKCLHLELPARKAISIPRLSAQVHIFVEMDLWIASIILLCAVIVSVPLYLCVYLVLRKLAQNPECILSPEFIESCHYPLIFGCPLFAIHLVFPLLSSIGGDWYAILRHLISVALILNITWLLGSVVLGLFPRAEPKTIKLKHDSLALRKLSLLVVGSLGLFSLIMTIPKAWEMGISGLVGLVVFSNTLGRGFTTTLENFVAGLQVSWSEPFALFDYVTVDGCFGRIVEIRGFYVVLQAVDKSQHIIPLSRFIGGAFQNWSRGCEHRVGEVTFSVDYLVPVAKLREKFLEVVEGSSLWDKQVASLKVAKITGSDVQIQCSVSATNVEALKELECEVREKLLEFMVHKFCQGFPRVRNESVESGHHHTWYQHITNRTHG